jgi:hypothetical protein
MESQWDVFVSHAYEDKDAVVRPLANRLKRYGLQVWFDEFSLKIGDSLRASIDKGLKGSRFGLVVLSPSFFIKKWTNAEYDSLVQLEDGAQQIILPVWFGVGHDQVVEFSPALAGKMALRLEASEESIDRVALEILERVHPDLHARISRRRALLKAHEVTNPVPFASTYLELVKIPDGPVFQDVLPLDLLRRIRLVRAAIADVHPGTLESWIADFQRERRPYQEIVNWEHVAGVYLEVKNAYALTLARRLIVYTIILERNMFVDDLSDRHAPLLKRLPRVVRSFLEQRINSEPPFGEQASSL